MLYFEADDKIVELQGLLLRCDEEVMSEAMRIVENVQQDAFLAGYKYAIEVLKDGLIKRQSS